MMSFVSLDIVVTLSSGAVLIMGDGNCRRNR